MAKAKKNEPQKEAAKKAAAAAKDEQEMKAEDAAEETAEAVREEKAAGAPDADGAGEAESAPEEAAEDPAGEEEGSKSEEDSAKGFFKKKNKKDPKDEKIADLTDKLQRQMAEFENFRRRTDKEKSTMYDMGARDMIERLLPVIDNFERGLDSAKEEDPFAEGMRMIYRQLMTMLTESGVTPIEAAGQTFDPELHNAVMHVDDENYGENIVAEELQKGYMYKDHVVRHSMVKVAN